MALAQSAGTAQAADGQGGGGDTNSDLRRACKSQAQSQKLAENAAATFVQRCANTPINPAARKSGDKLRGVK
jgi:hypothetical protein